jgi:hypothetical protein
VTPKPFWLAAVAVALPLAAPAARAAEADRPTLPKCLAHAKALCFWHHPACLALDAAASLGWAEWSKAHYTAAMPASRPHPVCHPAPAACPPCCPPAPGCVTPACACVPAGAPMPCWGASTCWQPPLMPPPVAVGASMPCPAPPMPSPAPGCFPGTTPAPGSVAVWADPMPFYVPCCATPAPGAAHYLVETKLMRSGPGGVIERAESKCLTAEGAPIEVAVHGPPDHPDQTAGALGVCVAPASKHKVGLEMSFECCSAYKCGKDGERMQCDCARVCRTIPVGKPTHVALLKGPGGAEEAWVEVTVTEAPHAGPERIAKAPKPAPPACPLPGAVAGVAAAVGEMCGCRAAAAGMTLPSGQYLQHPPQYFPPSPAFPLPRELAAQEAVPMPPPAVAPPWPGMVMPAPLPVPVMAVPVPAPARPAAGSVVRVVSADGKARLEVRGAGAPCIRCKSMVLEAPHGDAVKLTAGKGRVVVCGPDMKAWADGVRTAGRHRIVLEGHVRLVSHHDGHEAHIKADVLEVSLEGEHVEVWAAPDAE